ncbi:MAG TPA: metallophosphoesterase [Pilimelia sp.]|nr:metallophosphoesterase [Pilimelia sp.]
MALRPTSERPRAAMARARRLTRLVGRGLRRGLTGPAARATGVGLAIAAVAVFGIVLGVLLGGRTAADIGPFHASLQLTPSLVGDAEVDVPPLGALHLDSHDGPAHLTVRFDALDQARTERLINDPNGVARVSEGAVHDVTLGAIRLGLRTLGVALLTAMALAALVFRDVRRVAWTGGLALAVTMSSLAVAVGTFRQDAIDEPRYEGLLVNAPALVGDARRIADRYDQYAGQLQKLVNNVTELYTAVSTLPVFQPDVGITRVLHVSDLHLNPTAWSVISTVVTQFEIDAVVDTGDITDWGSDAEATYVAAIGRLGVPYVYIRGNHDSALTAQAVARQPNATVLNGTVTTVAGLTVAGIGDPRFTPDKDDPANAGAPAVGKQTAERVLGTGAELANVIRASGRPVDIALLHDPASASGLAGACPVVLAGHTHNRTVSTLAGEPGADPTRLFVSGSTGGAGLRGLEAEDPVPLSMSVLYFDNARTLQAHDDIVVGGAGLAQVTLERHVVDDGDPDEGEAPSDAEPTPRR